MKFKHVERVEYENNILFEVVFQARFPEIMRISGEEPVAFQDIIRKKGYPESGTNIPNLPQDIPDDIKRLISSDKSYLFSSEDNNWQISLTKNFIALTCRGEYLNFTDFHDRLKVVLETFTDVYEPSYFSRTGLRYRNNANRVSLPLYVGNIRDLIPEYIFPELKEHIATETVSIEKKALFDDGNIKVNVNHTLAVLSGQFGKNQITDQESYIIDIDCFSETNTHGVKNVLTKCKAFKDLEWNIFQWSVNNQLRESMGNEQ